MSLFVSNDVRTHIQNHKLSFDLLNATFVLGFMLVAAIGVPTYLFLKGASWGPWILAFVLYWVAGLGVTMGYHRYFSHRSFDSHPVIEFLLLIAGTMSLQNSALKWSSDHRKHHSFTDTDKDPYNAKLGFWWSHILWIFYSDKEESQARFSGESSIQALQRLFPNCRDLIQKPMIRLQHKLSIPMGLILSFGIPALVGYWAGDLGGYVLIAGFLRVALLHNSTFFINSLAHIWGEQPHSTKDTSRNSFWLALLALGEGYHNYHHTYPTDYRNGVKAYHFDPTKWIIRGLSLVGLTSNLRVARATPVAVATPVEPLNPLSSIPAKSEKTSSVCG
jgi:stearoyl-CoA desaturase (delta-9 desaturase)